MRTPAKRIVIPTRARHADTRELAALRAMFCQLQRVAVVLLYISIAADSAAQQSQSNNPEEKKQADQISVNWLYGSYVPRDVPLKPLSARMRFKLYLYQTYLTPGIYAKTLFFAIHDQIAVTNPEWGEGAAGFAKRLGSRQGQFIIQNSVASMGDAIVGWEPRYDRCRCDGFWLRTRHAAVRNFVTYNSTEKSLRPQIMPYLGTFSGAALATKWQPDHRSWQIRGYQAAITQIFVGVGVNWLGEFAPDIINRLKKKK
jgi:hypothetical protein